MIPPNVSALSGCALRHTFGVRVQRGKVLKMDRPAAGGFLSLTAFQAEGCGLPLRAMLIKSALRIHLSVSYGKITILLNYLPSADTPPIRVRRTSPAVRSVNRKEGPFMGRLRAYFDRLAHPMQDVHRGRIKHLEASLRKRLYSKHGLLCHLEEGQRWWR